MKKAVLLLVSLTFFQPLAFAGDDSVDAPAEEIHVPGVFEIIRRLPKDMRDFGLETIQPENAGLVLGVLGMTAITVKTDYESWQAAQFPEANNEFVHQMSNYGVSMGDGFFQFGIVGGFLAAGAASGNRKALRTAGQITEAILSTGIVVQVLKHMIGRESPFSSGSRTGVWRPFPDQIEYNKDFQRYDAVPSGHLSTATTTLLVIQENYPEQKWIPFIGYPILGFISYGLVGTSIHWWSDFPSAIAIGYSMARIVTRPNRKEGEFGRPLNAWTPVVYPGISNEGEPILIAGWSF